MKSRLLAPLDDAEVLIFLVRGINVGGNRMLKMEALRAICETLGLADVRAYIQSGNVVCRSDGREPHQLSKQIEESIENLAGFRPNVVARTAAELRSVIQRNPFTGRSDVAPSKLGVTFLGAAPDAAAREKALAMSVGGDELRMDGREMYIHYPNGMGKSKLPMAAIERTLKTPATTRNWNTVEKLMAMAEDTLRAGR